MASDKDIKNKKPNTLDDIGSSSRNINEYESLLKLTEYRANVKTLEMIRHEKRIEQLQVQLSEAAKKVGSLPISGTSSGLLRELMGAGRFEEALKRSQIPNVVFDQPMSPIARSFTISKYEEFEASKQKSIAEQFQRISTLEQSRKIDAERLLQQHIISSTKDPRKGIRSLSKELGVQVGAGEYFETATLTDLLKGQSRAMRSVNRLGAELSAASENVLTEGGQEQFLAKAQQYETGRRKLAKIDLALRMKEEQKYEDETIVRSSEKFAAMFGSRRMRESIREESMQGSYGSPSDIKKKIVEKEEEFITALSKFREELNKTGEVTQGVRDRLNEARSSLEEHNEALKHSKDISGERLSKFGAGIGIAKDILSTASYGFVGADQEQMQLRIRAAQMTNTRFFDQYAAAQGDMSALRRFQQKQLEQAALFGNRYADRQTAMDAAGIGLDVANLSVSGQAVRSFGVGQLSNLSGTANNTAVNTIALGKGITRGATQLSFASQYMQLMDEINKAPDFALQQYRDFAVNTSRSMIGAGINPNELYSKAKGMRQPLAELGISPDRLGQLFSMGIANIGPGFSNDPNRAGNIVRRGAQFERAGVMGAEQYMANVAQLVSAGGSEKNLEDLFASAVARGVDDAKSLQGIVNLTTSMSRDAASRGVNMAGGMGAALSTGLDILKNAPIDESLKQSVAANALERTLSRQRQGGLNIENAAALSSLYRRGLSPLQAGRVATMDVLELTEKYKTYKGQLKPGETVSTETYLALGDAASLFVDREGKARSEKDIRGAIGDLGKIKTFGFGYGANANKLYEKIMSGYKPTAEEISKSGLPPNLILGAMQIYGATEGMDKKKVNLSQDPLKIPSEFQAAMAIGGAGAIAQSNLIRQGTMPENIIGGMSLSAAQTIDANKAGAEAAGSAEKMIIDIEGFNKTIVNFNTAISNLEKAIKPFSLTGGKDEKGTGTGSLAGAMVDLQSELRSLNLNLLFGRK